MEKRGVKFSDLDDRERALLLNLAKSPKQRIEEARRYVGQKSAPPDVLPPDGSNWRLLDEGLIEYIEVDQHSMKSYPGTLIVTSGMGDIAVVELTEKGREVLANAVIES